MQALKALVVDDEVSYLEMIAEILRQLKVDVHAESNSQHAAQQIEQEKYDAILLDIGMPNLNGYQLATRARESARNQDTPIVIITGREDPDAMTRSFSLGATYFLHKPVGKEQLVEIISDIRRLPHYEEERRFVRVPLNAEIICTVGSKQLTGVTWNISQGGIQLEVNGLQDGDVVGMSFVIPHAVVKAQGRVVWAKDDRQGLNFTDMNVESQEAIRAYVAGTMF